MEYTDDIKLEILKSVLAEHGLSFEDYEVDYFFNRSRYLDPILEEYDEDGKREYYYSDHVRTKKTILIPSDFENSSYGKYGTLLDWYLYRNWNERTLVWENVGKEKFDIKKSFVEDRNQYSNRICQDIRGNIFNRGDGNHRLVLLMINHFLERISATNDEERKLVDKKYEMELDVEIPIKKELCYLLMKEFDQMEKVCPRSVVEFRKQSYKNYKESSEFVQYNEDEERFYYILNGVKFAGKEDELIDFLKSKEKMKSPIMTWEADGVYYISCENKIWYSANKEEMIPLYHRIKQSYQKGEIAREDFLEIKNVKDCTYEISYAGCWIEDKQQALKIGSLFEKVFLKLNNELFFGKLQDAEYWRASLAGQIERCHDFFGGISIPELKHKNLTKEEYVKLREMYSTLTQEIKQIATKEQEI